jgi:hypothetical protein
MQLDQNPMGQKSSRGWNDTQHNNTQDNNIQNNDTQHNDTQHNNIQHNDTQHNGIRNRVCRVPLMLNVVYAKCP